VNLRKTRFRFLGRRGAFDFDFNQLGAGGPSGAGFGVHAPGGDQLSLGELVGGEYLQDRGEVLVGEFVGLAAEKAASMTAGEISAPGDVTLIKVVTLGLALKGNAEIAHLFVLRVPSYGTMRGWQQGWWLRIPNSDFPP
jgi:hypothetical protein